MSLILVGFISLDRTLKERLCEIKMQSASFDVFDEGTVATKLQCEGKGNLPSSVKAHKPREQAFREQMSYFTYFLDHFLQVMEERGSPEARQVSSAPAAPTGKVLLYSSCTRGLNTQRGGYTVKKRLAGFLSPPGSVWLVTSRMGMGKPLTFFTA
jgi:hypothetical protein